MFRDPANLDSTQNIMPQKQETPNAVPQPFQTRLKWRLEFNVLPMGQKEA
jgi:hypothetical protein